MNYLISNQLRNLSFGGVGGGMQKLPNRQVQNQGMFNQSSRTGQPNSMFNSVSQNPTQINGLMRVNANVGNSNTTNPSNSNSTFASSMTFGNRTGAQNYNSSLSNNPKSNFQNGLNTRFQNQQQTTQDSSTSWPQTNFSLYDKKIKLKGVLINRDPQNMHLDTIDGMCFVEMNNMVKLFTTGWDKTVRVWNCAMEINNSYNMPHQRTVDPPKGYMKTQFETKIELGVYGMGMDYVPELKCIFIYCGDCTIRKLDLSTMQVSVMMNLSYMPMRAFYVQQMNVVIVCGYHNHVEVYQLSNLAQPSMKAKLAAMCVAADLEGQLFVIGMRNDMICALEVFTFLKGAFSSMAHLPSQKSLLESPISKIRACPRNGTFVVVSVDGRIINTTFKVKGHSSGAKEILIPSSIDENVKTFIFMGHGKKYGKNKTNVITKVFNINSVCSHSQVPGFVVTAGSDQNFTFWDLNSKSKIKSLDLGADISTATLSRSGKYAAVAIGYSWSAGIWGVNEAPRPAIATFPIFDKDTKAPPAKKKKTMKR